MAEAIDKDVQALLEGYMGFEPTRAEQVFRVAQKALTPLGKIFDVADTGLNLAVNLAKPLVLDANPELSKVYDEAPKKFGIPNLTFSDLFEASGKEGKLDRVAGFALDVAFDPITWLSGVGTLTKTGRVVKAVEGAVIAKTRISPTSKIGVQAAEVLGEQPGIKAITRARKELKLGESIAEQAEKHQRALVSVGIPFTGIDYPVVYGTKILSTIDDISKYIKEKPGKAIYKLFATSSGNPKFDAYREEMVSMGKHLANVKKMEAKTFARAFDRLVKETGEEPEFLKKSLIDLVENPEFGNYSAMSVMEKNAANIKRRLYDNKEDFEKVFKTINGVTLLNQREKGKLFRAMFREITDINTFGNPYTLGFRQLPTPLRGTFAKEIARQSGMYTLKDVSKSFHRYVEYDKILDAFTRGRKYKGVKLNSEDSALLEYLGTKEFGRVKQFEDYFKALPKDKITKEYQKAATEVGAARNAIRQSMAHIDESFTMSYMMYRSHPKLLQKINPKVFKIIDDINANPKWKVDSLIDQFHLPKRMADKYPLLYDAAQVLRREWRIIKQEENFAGVPGGELISDTHYSPHIPTVEIREFLEQHLPKQFEGASKEWSIKHVHQLHRRFQVVDKRKVNEAFNYGLITPVQRKALLGKGGKKYVQGKIDSKEWSKEFGAKLIHTMTASEINSMAQLGTIKLLNKRKFDKFFDDNPVELLRIRGQRASRAITSAEFFEGAKRFGTMVPATSKIAPEGYRFVNSDPLNAVIKGERIAFEPEIAQHIDAFRESLKLPAAGHPFVEKFDVLNDLWKAWTLAIFPATHIRDLAGNVYNNFLAGMNNPSHLKYYKEALELQTRATLKTSERVAAYLTQAGKSIDDYIKPSTIVTGTGQKITGDALIQEARQHGVLDMLWFYGDVEKYFEQEAKSTLGKIARGGYVLDAGLGVKKYLQNNANLAHYIWKRTEGLSAADAAASVKKYQFDYSQLSNVEKQVFRRIIPFYTWTRKNVPLQLEALITTPNKPIGVNKFIGSFVETNYDGVPDERYLPDWMLQNFPVRVKKNDETGNFEYFLLGSWLPLADIDKIFNPARFIGTSLSPALKEPIQQMFNKDLYYNVEIDKGDEYERFLTMSMPKRVSHALRNLRILAEVDRSIDKVEDKSEVSEKVIKGVLSYFRLAKFYPYDPELQREFLTKDYKSRESRLKSQLKKAREKGDENEQDRIQRRIEQLVEEKANKLY